MKKLESDEHRSLLLFSSAVGIGSAEKCLSSNSNIKKFLESTSGEIMQAPRAENLLRVAASLGNADRAEKWIAGLSPERKKMSKMLARRLLHSRIVVFVDDLDRGQENVILQILSGVNLVLAVGKINVIFGMDKRMMEGRGLSGGKIVNA
ncbi:uncharacterized protein LOC131071668 [Cryptomeria japonica]|uniref:uncharacterized protein LOC131071668 n=1 Tax=Cryptomeria japonica TaxID=3369 RepID=UPI0027DA0C42|nr:uncharacterized protein LOC131071668 [Cryptomeria japonica]